MIAPLCMLTTLIVAGRARQLNHRLRNRKNAIVSRREAEAFPTSENGASRASPSAVESSDQNVSNDQERRESNSPTSGFVAVNSRPVPTSHNSYGPFGVDASKVQHAVSMNGKSYHGASASPATRAELLNYFNNVRERSNDGNSVNDHDGQRASSSAPRIHSSSKLKSRPGNDIADYANILLNSASPVAIPNTPSSLQYKPPVAEKFDDSGPYKAEMLSRMDSMQRGDRVMPPCDRCRRLHMDCLKNLTACQGCTKKHAKCSWKDVSEQELLDNPFSRAKESFGDTSNGIDPYSPAALPIDMEGTPQGVPDEELLGEESDDGGDPHSHSLVDEEDPSHNLTRATDNPEVTEFSDSIDPPAPKAPMLTDGDLDHIMSENHSVLLNHELTALKPAANRAAPRAERSTMPRLKSAAYDLVDPSSAQDSKTGSSPLTHSVHDQSPSESGNTTLWSTLMDTSGVDQPRDNKATA